MEKKGEELAAILSKNLESSNVENKEEEAVQKKDQKEKERI